LVVLLLLMPMMTMIMLILVAGNDDAIDCRTANWNGISQDVHLVPGHTYHFRAFIQLLTTPAGVTSHDIEILLAITSPSGKFICVKEWSRLTVIYNVTVHYLHTDGNVNRFIEGQATVWNENRK
jgi:hypothetical protein